MKFSYAQLQKISRDIFVAFGFNKEEADIITDVLLTADLYGVESHGVQRLVRYYASIKNDSIKVDAKPEIVFETPVSAVVDGNAGMGQLISYDAMNLAIKKAKESGVGMVTVRNSNHFGIAGYYSKMATDQGLIGIAMTNTEPLMVHTFSKKATLGTNPIAVSAPADPVPFWFDAATVVVPRGKLEVYYKKNKPLREGWAVDENGQVCTDAARVLGNFNKKADGGGILPLGGAEEETGSHKGYGFAMICEIFCAVLSGGTTSNHHTRQNGQGAGTAHYFMAIDPKLFGDPAAIQAHLSAFLQELRDAPLAEGKLRIYTHGEKEQIAAKEHMENGLEIDISTVGEMKTIFDYLGIDSKPYIGDVDLSGMKESLYK